jgi:hypothetical protein
MMDKIRHGRQLRQLTLDGLFVVLLLHFFVTGSIVPGALLDLFRENPQIVVSTEPAHLPRQDSESAPLIVDGDLLPETRNPGFGASQTNL